MDKNQDKELVKRIAKLVKQNKDLARQVKELSEKSEKLQKENETQQAIIEQLNPSPEALSAIKSKKSKSLRFKMVTVLFADIQGFSKISEHRNSQEIIDALDEIFIKFDEIIQKYKIEKIKTIGDAYMCASGIPQKNHTNPIEMVLAVLEMQRYLEELHRENKIWEVRFGIHTGPVIAETVGKKKISYNIKGETVNIATRMEASSEIGKVNISGMTYELIKEFFVCEYYGKMPVKYKGDLEMYFVKGIKPSLSLDKARIEPNASFKTKFGLIQFGDIQEVILDKLEKELPDFLFYHNVKHTIDVVTEVELIGLAEGVSDEEILLLKTAGLFHDAGHTIDYDTHEYQGTLMAREILPRYGYANEQIETICDIVMATKLPPQPQNLLQKIICDADLDYLGRSDFIPVSNTLYRELKAQDKIGTLNQWNKLQIKFLSGHQFFTNTARNLREVNKQKQIDRIKQLITDDDDEPATAAKETAQG